MDEVSTATDITKCENHVSAQTESSESHRCEVTPIQKMARKATEELKAAELKTRCRPSRNRLRSRPSRNRLRSSNTKTTGVQQTVQQFQAGEEARTIAAKESKSREAAVETNREGGC